MTDNIGLYTYGIAGGAYLLLVILLVAQWRVRPLGPALIAAAAATAIWATVVAAGTLYIYPPIVAIEVAEFFRVAAWLFFLLQLLGFQDTGNIWRWMGRAWLPPFAIAAVLTLAVLGGRPLSQALNLDIGPAAEASLMVWLVLATLGLVLVEQVYRNASASERWGVKYLCLALGSGFAFDFFLYAEALLFKQLNPQLWQARGLVFAALLPWLVIAIARNRSWRMNVYVSRYVVFHTVTLMAAGVYLLCMALIGYFIRFMGGSWGGVLQVGFFAGAGAVLATLLFSTSLRARLRVILSKHFFSYRYDYREEWLRFTQGMSSANENTGESIIKLMASISLSKAGLLFQRGSGGDLNEASAWDMTIPDDQSLGNLPQWIVQSGWVVDIREWRDSRDLYGELDLPDWLRNHPSLWLIVPLLFQDQLEGLLFLSKTDFKARVNWEDRDLLKTAGRQAAALMAQQRTSHALVEARQFDAFNRLSAYVIHDLKNILAQQSLMVANAKKHRDNPAFIDDMIATVDNSVRRMQRLMDQMRSGMRTAAPKNIALGTLLQQVVANRAQSSPEPRLRVHEDAIVSADSERLTTVFAHLVQNAQEATENDGVIELSLTVHADVARVQVVDSGCGMSDTFIRSRLFKPFESTKGLTGMGIGAFESREYVRQLGGDIVVQSTPGAGSEFTVSLPITKGLINSASSFDVSAEDCEPGPPQEPDHVAN